MNEFWTSRQRQASSLHEVSYRACFKPQLPRFFITALTQPNDLIYDPFAGSGTAVIAAQQTGRRCVTMEIDPGYCDVIVERWEKFTGCKAETERASAPLGLA